MEIEVEIDEYDVLNNIPDDLIIEYLKNNGSIPNNRDINYTNIDYTNIDYNELVYAAYHGDFDVDKFLKLLKWEK